MNTANTLTNASFERTQNLFSQVGDLVKSMYYTVALLFAARLDVSGRVG